MITSPSSKESTLLSILASSKYEFFFCGSRELQERFPEEFTTSPDTNWNYAISNEGGSVDYLRQLGFKTKSENGRIYWHQDNISIFVHSPYTFAVFKAFWAEVTPEFYRVFLNSHYKFDLVFELIKPLFNAGLGDIPMAEPTYGDQSVIIQDLKEVA